MNLHELDYKEEFDIDKYKFTCDELAVISHSNIDIGCKVTGWRILEYVYFGLRKQDAIAIAKHFKLTGDDL